MKLNHSNKSSSRLNTNRGLFNWIYLLAFIPLQLSTQTKQNTLLIEDARPNILFCVADDASYQYLKAYGGTWVNTPAFDRVATAGLLFLNAYTPNAKCSPSRACILTGRNPWQLEEAANHVPFFPLKFTTDMEALSQHGYHTGFTGKGWAPGNPGQINGRNRQLTGIGFNTKKLAAPSSGISANDYAANFEEFLNSKEQGQPFCFWYGSNEPHRVYEFGSGITKGKKKLSDIKKVPLFWPDNDTVRNDMLDYAYEMEYFDSHLGKMLQMLEARGELDNTIVVVTSDNGAPFPRVKGNTYEFSNHLPLAIMWKKGIQQPGRRISEFVSFADFAPTFLQAAGLAIEQAGMQPVQGQSLLPFFRNEKKGIKQQRDYVLLGRERNDVGRPNDEGYPTRAIVKSNFIYIKNYEPHRWPAANPETGYLDTDGSPTKTTILQGKRNGIQSNYWNLAFGKRPAEELYQLDKDPDAVNNLAQHAAFATVKKSLEQQMEKELKAQGDPRMWGKGSIFDQYPYAEPQVRDFYNRMMKGEKMKANWVNETDFERAEQ